MAYYDDGYIWAQDHTTHFPITYQDPVSFSSYQPYDVDTDYDAYNCSMFDDPKPIDYGDYSYDYNYGHDYGNCHDWYVSSDPAISYLALNYMEPKSIVYEPIECDTGYVSYHTQPSISYFAHNYMEPKSIVYEPVECDTGYVSYHTQRSISYSQVNPVLNEPEFEEYDPTPYGGGYDIISVYGKPLPPSNQTCYPRSKPKPNSESQPPTKSTQEPVPVPIALPEPEPTPKPKPKPMPEPEPEPRPKPEPELKLVPVPVLEHGPGPVHALVPAPDPIGNYGYDYPWPEYDNGNRGVVGYDYGYGYGKQVVQIPPSEYSEEVVDLCENLFGSWPCLARIRKQQMCIENNSQMTCNPWEECANDIFGHRIPFYDE